MSDGPIRQAEERARIAAAARDAARRRAGAGRAQAPTPAMAAGPSAPRFEDLPAYREMQRMEAAGVVLDIPTPFFRRHEGLAGARTSIAGQALLNFASYDYCGLNADPRVMAAAKAAIDAYGVSPSGSRLVAGERPIHAALEEALARHYGAEAAVCFVSGHSTNASTIGCLMGEGDLILHDALCHNSIEVGMRLSGAARRSFPHNDMAALEAILAESRGRYRNALIVTEGLFSMDGDLPPLAALIEMKRRHGCWLMVDEAHALGCVGAGGAGSFAAQGVDPGDVDIWMGTLSKSLAATGGYIAGGTALIAILRAYAPGFVFSVALAPALAAAAETALRLLQAEPQRVEKLQANAALFLEEAGRAGLLTGTAGPFGIVPVMVGDSILAARLSDTLFRAGINVLPVMFPAVPMRAARLRFFLSALHEPDEIRQAVATTAGELARLREEGVGTAVPAALLAL